MLLDKSTQLESSQISLVQVDLKKKKSDLCMSLVWLPNLLSDKSTQTKSSHISLVQVDLEQIKYRIKYTFLDQIEMQAHR